MRAKFIIFILVILIVVVSGVFFIAIKTKEKNFEKKREKILSQLYLSIEEAEEIGKYKCCIEPPCTMCYLGDWIFDDGTCDCEEMIARGEWDKVCPQCVRGIKEGRCKSEIGTCPAL